MADLKWLDGSGETTDELLALEGDYRVDSLVLAFEEGLAAKALALQRRVSAPKNW